MLKVITFNAAILDVCVFGYSFYRPLEFIQQRLQHLAIALEQSDADIIFLQELFHRNYQDTLSHALKRSYPYVLGHAPRGWKLRLGNELLIFSRFPLTDGKLVRFSHAPAEELRHTSKGFYHAQVILPAIGPLNLINFHMSAGGKHLHPQSSTMEAIRQKQIEQFLDYSQKLNQTLLAGDLNAGPEVSTDNYEQMLTSNYHDLFSQSGAKGISWDPDNPLVKQGSDSHLPAQRIDHIFADSDLFENLNVTDANIVFDDHCVSISSDAVPLSDHYGLSMNIEWKTTPN
jgi:endonuclease/exonuclease/phosphatase family metal-dependent hydrolase